MQNNLYLFLLSLLFFPFLLRGQVLVADINQSAIGSNPTFVRAGSDYLVFTASSSRYGRELFISDGTEAGTKLVGDLNPGNASSQFWDVSIIDSLCYFAKYVDSDKLQYWRFSLKNPQPVLLKTLQATGFSSSQNGNYVKFEDQIYFIHRSDNFRNQLWKTDGTPEGTIQVHEFGQNVFPEQFNVFNNQLIFLAQDSRGLKQLWKSDGTTQGTSLIKSVDTQRGVTDYEVFNSRIYFVANDGISGWDIWQSDATAEGTQLSIDLEANTLSRIPGQLTVVGNKLFFTANDANHGLELWMSEGTQETTRLVKDIFLGKTGSFPYGLTAFKQNLLFVANDGQFGAELWVSDGTAEGTQLIKDVFPGTTGAFASVPLKIAANQNQFFFVAMDSIQGISLWRTDGTSEGTILLSPINTGINLLGETELALFKQDIYFKTQDGVHGLELWKSNGTPEDVKIFTKLNVTGAGSSPHQIRVFKDQLFFSARTETLGFELWKSDGTAAGTQLVKDLYPGPENGDILLSTLFKDQYVFAANTFPRSRYLWKSDGTTEGTVVLRDKQGRGISSTEYITVLKDKLIFNAYTPEFGEELWVSDGTEMGTHILKDIDTLGQSFPYFPFSASILHDSLLLFTASNGTKHNQLWKTDGTNAGTTLLAEQALMGKEVDDILGKFGDSVIFSTQSLLAAELWISDGSDEGTKFFKLIYPGALAGSFQVLGKAFYFVAGDLSHGTELWKSDGTNNGTFLLKDILPGDKGSFPQYLTKHQDELFFVVGENANGKDALWKTDGTAEGTMQIKQIATGDKYSYIRNLFSWGKHVYFSADDGVNGHELWRSDGTEGGTQMLFDLNAGSASSDPNYSIAFKNDLYFLANDGIHGYELWRLLSDNVVSVDESQKAEILVFPNPTINQLIVRRNAEDTRSSVRLYDASGRTVLQYLRLNEEYTELNVSNLLGGIYFLEIKKEGNSERQVKKILIVR